MSEESPVESSRPPESYEQNPWDSSESIVKEIKKKKQSVDYKQLLQGKRALLLADNHSNSSIRLHIAQHAQELKEAGITHYAIEADDKGKAVFDRLNQGEDVDLSGLDVGPAESAAGLSRLSVFARMTASGLSPSGSFSEGPYEGRRGDEYAIREIAKQGIKVVPIDMDQSGKPSREEREAHLTRGITRILESDSDAKVAGLIGGNHTLKKYESEGVPSVGKRVAEAGFATSTIQFTGGKSDMPRMITGGAREAGTENQEFLLDMQPYANVPGSVPYGAGETDYVVHLPQEPDVSRESMRLGVEPYRMSPFMSRPSEAESLEIRKSFSEKEKDSLKKFLDSLSKRDSKEE